MFRHIVEKSSRAAVYVERIAAAFLVVMSSLPLLTIAAVTLT